MLICSRYANYYYENGVQRRDLIKAYGILFVLKVAGEAGKFSVVPLLLNVGSGLGLLAIVSRVQCCAIAVKSATSDRFYCKLMFYCINYILPSSLPKCVYKSNLFHIHLLLSV